MNDYRNSTEIGAGGQRTLPAAAYLSAALFEREMRQLFHNDWLCVAREQDVPAAGSFMTRQIGCESVVIVRDHEQHIRAHFNVCRHRGTRLCDAAAGQLGRTIQCPYHAWTYALNGELVGVPDGSQLTAFDRREFGLHPVACHVWGGFVWLSLAREPQPFTESHAPIIARCQPWSLDSLVRLGQRTYQVQANWKLIVQNYSECLDPQRGIEFWDRVNQEDWHVSELTQQGVRSSRYEPGPYSDREAMSASIDRHYLNRMGGIASDEQQES